LGQMSLIGPRPERPEFVTQLAKTVPNYLDRLSVLPGVTGLAQINLPADDSLESVRQKVILDREYIRSATLALDLRIFCCTLLRMTGLRHGVAPWLFGVECVPESILPSATESGDTLELAGSLDDTSINIPALIASPEYAATSGSDSFQHPSHVAFATKRTQKAVSSLAVNSDETPSPRRPR